MKEFSGQILLKKDDIALIESVFSKNATLKEGTEYLSQVELDKYYILLDLLVADDGTYTPYLTLALYDEADDYRLCDIDIEFENVDDIFGAYTFEVEDANLNIIIAKDENSDESSKNINALDLLTRLDKNSPTSTK